MKYKNYIWIFFIFAITAVVYYIRKQNAVEGFMTEDEFVTEANHRIKTMQAIKASINDSLNAFDKSAKETCDLTIKYRDAFVSATAALPKYNSLTNDDRQKTARTEYDEQRIKYIASGKPIYECFATQDEVDAVTKKLKSEMKELSDLLGSPLLRTMLQKGKLLDGLQGLNSMYSGSKMVFEAFVVDEDLLESADFLIKEVRKIQTISRLAVINTSTLTTDLVKIPEFVKGLRYSSSYTQLNVASKPSKSEVVSASSKEIILQPSINILVLSGENHWLMENVKAAIAFTNLDINIDSVIQNSDDGRPAIAQIQAKLNSKVTLIIVDFTWNVSMFGASERCDFNKYLENKGNAIFACSWTWIPYYLDRKYVSFENNGGTIPHDYVTLQSVEDNPIVNDELNNKELVFNTIMPRSPTTMGRVSSKTKSDLAVLGNAKYDRNGQRTLLPIVAVKTVNSSRIVSMNLIISHQLNKIGQKLLARCILWAVGRI